MSNDRRRFLKTAGLALVGASLAPTVAHALTGKAGRKGSGSRGEGASSKAGPLPPLFDDIQLDGWTIRTIVPHLGAIAVVLDGEDGRFQLDVLKKDDRGPEGVAHSRSLAIFVQNRGRGRLPTSEDQALAARALAELLDAREAAGASVPPLSTITERVAEHPRGIFEIEHSPKRRPALG